MRRRPPIADPLRSDDYAELLRAARGGSPEALGKLWAVCRVRLLATANREIAGDVRAKAGASDAVQETFLRAQQALDRFSGETLGELLAWLRTILRNHLSHVRRRYHTGKRQVARELPLGMEDTAANWQEVVDRGPSPGSAFIEHERAQHIESAMRRLAGDYRRALELRYWEQLSFNEIGRKMGRTAEAARKLWARALVKLQQELDHEPT